MNFKDLGIAQWDPSISGRKPTILGRDISFDFGITKEWVIDTVTTFRRPTTREMFVTQTKEGATSDTRVSARRYMRARRPQRDLLEEIMSEGATIVLRHLERYHDGIAELTKTFFEHYPGRTTMCVLFCKNKVKRALRPHMDRGENFIVQMRGSQTVYAAPSGIELHRLNNRVNTCLPRFTAWTDSYTIKEGDVFVLPPGWIHAFEANDDQSIHIALGYHPPYPVDVIESVARIMATDLHFQKILTAFPPDTSAEEVRRQTERAFKEGITWIMG